MAVSEHVGIGTVKTHVARLLAKLEARGRVHSWSFAPTDLMSDMTFADR